MLRSFLVVVLILYSSVQSQELKIYHIDVNQGDATLFVMPNSTSMLIDAGEDNMADEVAKIVKDSVGLSHIDVFVASHYHSDHYGGIDKLVKNEGISVIKFYDRDAWNWLPDSKKDEDNFKEYDTTSMNNRQRMKNKNLHC